MLQAPKAEIVALNEPQPVLHNTAAQAGPSLTPQVVKLLAHLLQAPLLAAGAHSACRSQQPHAVQVGSLLPPLAPAWLPACGQSTG